MPVWAVLPLHPSIIRTIFCCSDFRRFPGAFPSELPFFRPCLNFFPISWPFIHLASPKVGSFPSLFLPLKCEFSSKFHPQCLLKSASLVGSNPGAIFQFDHFSGSIPPIQFQPDLDLHPRPSALPPSLVGLRMCPLHFIRSLDVSAAGRTTPFGFNSNFEYFLFSPHQRLKPPIFAE